MYLERHILVSVLLALPCIGHKGWGTPWRVNGTQQGCGERLLYSGCCVLSATAQTLYVQGVYSVLEKTDGNATNMHKAGRNSF